MTRKGGGTSASASPIDSHERTAVDILASRLPASTAAERRRFLVARDGHVEGAYKMLRNIWNAT